MDLYFDASDPTAVSLLRRELGRYFRRHAEPESDVEGADIALSELLTNVASHAAGAAWVHVDWTRREPRVEIHDLGPGFELEQVMGQEQPAIGGHGLRIVTAISAELASAAKRGGGTRVSAVMPVRRPVERSYDPPVRGRGALPSPEEASPEGMFGRESFLRALVVQLAQAVERDSGPDAFEATVAQVGADVGGRMEDEYRRARELVDDLRPEQIGDLYVRLKGAIGGDFYIIDVTPERIVLGNRACPFGDAVKRAPGLCRMTSSVFGGIAARNTGGAAVVLEERIAVGDPECRIVVWLGEQARGRLDTAHDYADPEA